MRWYISGGIHSPQPPLSAGLSIVREYVVSRDFWGRAHSKNYKFFSKRAQFHAPAIAFADYARKIAPKNHGFRLLPHLFRLTAENPKGGRISYGRAIGNRPYTPIAMRVAKRHPYAIRRRGDVLSPAHMISYPAWVFRR